MPLPVPRLDDRSFQGLVTEGRSLIPRYSGEWTNHNPSDPGITLLELFAYLTESSIFQLDQLPDESVELFLELVGVCRAPGEPIGDAAGRAVTGIAQRERAVTAAQIVARARALGLEEEPPVRRADLRQLEDRSCAAGREDPPSMAVVTIVPERPTRRRFRVEDELFHALKQRLPLASRVHVVRPILVALVIEAVVVRAPGSGITVEDLRAELKRFLDPLEGGDEGTGWPFGRAVRRSELFQRLERLEGVDYVESLVLAREPAVRGADPGHVAIPPTALIDVDRTRLDVEIKE